MQILLLHDKFINFSCLSFFIASLSDRMAY